MNFYMELWYSSAQENLAEAKRHVIGLMANKRQAEREVQQVRSRIAEYLGFAGEALDTGNESLAEEIAERIASLESQLKSEEQSNQTYYHQIDRLRDMVQGLEGRIHQQGLQTTLDYLAAAEELEEGAEDRQLDRKMKAAGIGKRTTAGQEVLERIKKHQTQPR